MVLTDDELRKLLVDNRFVTPQIWAEISRYARTSDIGIDEALVERNIFSEEDLGKLSAAYLKFPFVILSKATIPEELFRLIPERVARRLKVVAFSQDRDGIKIAMRDPRNGEFIEMLAKKTGQKIIPYLASGRDISKTFQIYKKDLQKLFDELTRTASLGKTVHLALDEAPIMKIVDLLIESAYEDKASDIHIEPQETSSLVRFRIDGILHDVLTAPSNLHDRIVTRIKVLSRLRTDEHLSAQDGKMQAKLEEENLDIRVSIIPIADGEKVVLRLLSSRSRQYSLSDLGMEDEDLKKVTNAFTKSYGMILSTGPTGSGKTTSIYSILKILNTREKNITTIEDPVEYRIKGVNQIQVNTKTNLTFANGLRSILRQDPNIIFVGEIRDAETAAIAVNAALTGHLVLSTLHTNDAATALPRLVDMGVEQFLVASTVNVIIAQRLMRKICDVCKTETHLDRSDLLQHLPAEIITKYFGSRTSLTVFEGKGCKICRNTGYTGRVGIFEVLEVSKEIKKLIAKKADSDEIIKQALSEGMLTMLDDGLKKVAKGVTTIGEVLRVTKVESL